MPRLPGISQKEAVRVFQKLGYRIVRESGQASSSSMPLAALRSRWAMRTGRLSAGMEFAAMVIGLCHHVLAVLKPILHLLV
jgi:hypothetical protein